MKYCKKCVMPDTRPGIIFDDQGICSACRHFEYLNSIDWEKRKGELNVLCDKFRGMNGNGYDCAIAVSGGKDSHFQVYVMKELMNMNPILFYVEDNLPMTEAGKHNVENISEEFGCPIVTLKPDRRLQKLIDRKLFEREGRSAWFISRLMYTFPLSMAIKFNTPLLVYGENPNFTYGGNDDEDTYSAKKMLFNGVALDIPWSELVDEHIDMKDLSLLEAPSFEDMNRLEPIYLGYFVKWDSYSNYIFAKSRGFHDLAGEWDISHEPLNYDQIDTAGHMVHGWLKYPKYGHGVASDQVSRLIRYGLVSREEGINLIKKYDNNLDSRCVREFCDFYGYTESEFWSIVDNLYNKDLFRKNNFGEWELIEKIL